MLLALVFAPLFFQKLIETSEYYHGCFRYVKCFRNYWILPKICDMQSCTFIDMIYVKPAKLKPKKYTVFHLMKGIVIDAPSPIPYQSWWPTEEAEKNRSQQCVTRKFKTSQHFLSKNLSSVICDFELWTKKFLWNVVSQLNKEATDKLSGDCREYLNLLSLRINTGKICFADGLRYSWHYFAVCGRYSK